MQPTGTMRHILTKPWTIPCPSRRLLPATINHQRSLPRLQSSSTKTISSAVQTQTQTQTQARSLWSSSKEAYGVNGLYGVEGLHPSPQALEAFTDGAVARTEKLRAELAARGAKPSAKTVSELDEISFTLCVGLDALELCRSTHEDVVIRSEADRNYSSLSGYVHQLNVDKRLYTPLKALVEEASVFQELSEEEQRVALALVAEFERDGIALSDEDKRRVFELQMKEHELQTKLSHQVTARKTPRLHVSRAEVENCPSSLQHLLSSLAQRADHMSISISASDEITRAVLTHAPCEALRKRFYVANNSTESFQDLNETLQALIFVRHVLAQSFGFESYAHLVTSDKMAKCPENVLAFLRERQESLREDLEVEMQMLLTEKQRIEGIAVTELFAWDLMYYKQRVLSERYGDRLAGVSSYFSMENCVHAFQLITARLFGIDMREEGFEHAEKWAGGIRKFVLRQGEQRIGTLYLDLFVRDGKYGNPCHMQLHTRGDNEELLPNAAVVCNVAASIGGARLTLLSVEQVSMLFHEFGHALHCLLSKTKLQFLAGTRGEHDFVETPAHLMEHFAFAPEVLELYAKHYVTGATMSSDMMEALNRSSSLFQASMQLQQQLLFSAVDQTLFGTDYNHNEPVTSPTNQQLLESLYEEFSITRREPNTAVISRFSHLSTYGAVYYSYAYGSAFAADLWKALFAANPLSRTAGTRYRESILRWGGTRDPSRMLEDALRP